MNAKFYSNGVWFHSVISVLFFTSSQISVGDRQASLGVKATGGALDEKNSSTSEIIIRWRRGYPNFSEEPEKTK